MMFIVSMPPCGIIIPKSLTGWHEALTQPHGLTLIDHSLMHQCGDASGLMVNSAHLCSVAARALLAKDAIFVKQGPRHPLRLVIYLNCKDIHGV